MLLGIDVGNTNIVIALIDKDNVIKSFRYDTAKQKTTEYHKEHILEFVGNQKIDGTIISSVVPEINDCLEQVCFDITGVMPIFVNARLRTGLDIKYDNPDKLGADLITAAVGAVCKYGSPAVIIDIGTATTFSVINEKNEYLGGMIAPGPAVSMKALASKASQLPEIELEATDKIIGTNTIDCLKIGTLTAHAAMIDGMLDRIQNHLDTADLNIISTGGISEEITSLCNHKIICDKNLIFIGLNEIYKLNNK